MTRHALLFALPLLSLPLAPQAALAQATTGTGGGPQSTIYAPNTSSVGQTMPRPGASAGDAGAGDARERRTPQQEADDRISRGICIGCGPK